MAEIGWYLILFIPSPSTDTRDHSSPVGGLRADTRRREAGRLCLGWVLAVPLTGPVTLDKLLALLWSFPLAMKWGLFILHVFTVRAPRASRVLGIRQCLRQTQYPALLELMCGDENMTYLTRQHGQCLAPAWHMVRAVGISCCYYYYY